MLVLRNPVEGVVGVRINVQRRIQWMAGPVSGYDLLVTGPVLVVKEFDL